MSYTTIAPSTFGIDSSFGSIQSVYHLLVFIVNLLTYLGWAGVYIGLGYVLMVFIYSLFEEDSKGPFISVKNAMTKMISIIVLGLILLSAGFILKFVANTLGYGNVNFDIPSVFK